MNKKIIKQSEHAGVSVASDKSIYAYVEGIEGGDKTKAFKPNELEEAFKFVRDSFPNGEKYFNEATKWALWLADIQKDKKDKPTHWYFK